MLLHFIGDHIGTIIVLAILMICVGAVVRGMVKRKKQGKSACGGCSGGCAACPMCGRCHAAHEKQERKTEQ